MSRLGFPLGVEKSYQTFFILSNRFDRYGEKAA
jgi:hypothetical protein